MPSLFCVCFLLYPTKLLRGILVSLHLSVREEGENCLADDQLEKEDPVRDVLDLNNFVWPALCQQYASSSKSQLLCRVEELELAVLALKDAIQLDVRQHFHLCSCSPLMSTLGRHKVSQSSACLTLGVRVATFQVAAVSTFHSQDTTHCLVIATAASLHHSSIYQWIMNTIGVRGRFTLSVSVVKWQCQCSTIWMIFSQLPKWSQADKGIGSAVQEQKLQMTNRLSRLFLLFCWNRLCDIA